jgi:hypothetical protein
MESLRIDFPHLYSIAVDWDALVDDADVIVVSKRYLKKALELRKPGQWILNYSETQGYSGEENFINIYN